MAIHYNGSAGETTQSVITGLPLTIALWAKGTVNTGELVVRLGAEDACILIAPNSEDGLLSASAIGSGKEESATFPTGLDATDWKHFAGVFTSATSRLAYTNGSAGTVSTADLSVEFNSTVTVGGDSSTSTYTDLTFAELAIWAAALTADEVASLAAGAQPTTIRPAALRFYWPAHFTSDAVAELMGGYSLAPSGSSWSVADNPPVLLANAPSFRARPVPTAPWQRLSHSRAVTILLAGEDITPYVEMKSVAIKDTGGTEVETASFSMRDPSALVTGPYALKALQIYADYGLPSQICLFAGYVMRVRTGFTAGGTEALYNVNAEGAKVLLHGGKPFATYWKGQTLATIITDIVTSSELDGYGFTVRAYDTTVGYWTITENETAAGNINRLCQENGWVWRVDWDYTIVIGPQSEDQAIFGLGQASLVDYYLVFPVENAEFEEDGAAITNAVQVVGGTVVSDDQVTTGTGTGSLTVFPLNYSPIYEIVSIEVDGTPVSWGTLGYHSCLERDALVNFALGYVEFCTAPGKGLSVEITWRYQFQYRQTFTDTASIAAYGITRWESLDAPWISDDTAAQALADSVFAERAMAPKRLNAEVRRLGLRAGQSVLVRFPALGLDWENLHLESIGTTLEVKSLQFKQSLRIGPKQQLSKSIREVTRRTF